MTFSEIKDAMSRYLKGNGWEAADRVSTCCRLEQGMRVAAECLAFEDAAVLHDRMRKLQLFEMGDARRHDFSSMY